MSKHTPGPWVATATFENVVARNGVVVCEVIGGAEDNARLLAAAPEILEALRDVNDRLYHHVGDADGFALDAVNRARAAIAKATGEGA